MTGIETKKLQALNSAIILLSTTTFHNSGFARLAILSPDGELATVPYKNGGVRPVRKSHVHDVR